MSAALDALARLREGNARFVLDDAGRASAVDHARRRALLAGQTPYAIVLGCSDSRVPAELVFDAGVGELFVIRVAGNIVAPSLVGSVEFAATKFGTRLVVVMGHSDCGAVQATIEELERPSVERHPNLREIVERVRPSVEPLLGPGGAAPSDLLERAVRANIRASANHLRHASAILEGLIADDGLLVVGAEYSLATGSVDFFDGAPERAGKAG